MYSAYTCLIDTKIPEDPMASLMDVLEVVAPYLDQQTALSLRLTCSASCCAQAVHELGHVLGSAKDATGSEATQTAFAAAVEAFPECSNVRAFCILRRPISPTEASAFSTVLQQLPKLHSLMLSEVKGQGSLRRPSNSTGYGTGAILPYLPLLTGQLQSLHIKCLRPPSNTATVLPRLQQLSMLCLDSVEGFSPQVLAAVGQLRGLRQVTVCLKHDWPLGQGLFTRSNGLEHLAPLSELSVLQVNLVGALPTNDGAYENTPVVVLPAALTALVQLRHLTLGGSMEVDLHNTPLAGQLHSLQFVEGATAGRSQDLEAGAAADADARARQEAELAGMDGPFGELQRELRAIDREYQEAIIAQFSQLTSLHWPQTQLWPDGREANRSQPDIGRAVLSLEGYLQDETVRDVSGTVVAAAMLAPAAVAAALAKLIPCEGQKHTHISWDYAAAAAAAAASEREQLSHMQEGSAAAAAAAAAVDALASVLATTSPPMAVTRRQRSSRQGDEHSMKEFVSTIVAAARMAYIWSRPPILPNLQRLRCCTTLQLALVNPQQLTALALHTQHGFASFPISLLTNLVELALTSHAEPLQQILESLPRLRRLQARLGLSTRRSPATGAGVSEVQFEDASLHFPAEAQQLEQISLSVDPYALPSYAPHPANSTFRQPPPPMVLIDLPTQHLTRLSLQSWLFESAGSGLVEAAAAPAGGAGAAAGRWSGGAAAQTTEPPAASRALDSQACAGQQTHSWVVLPSQLEHFTFRGIPSNTPPRQRPWPSSTDSADPRFLGNEPAITGISWSPAAGIWALDAGSDAYSQGIATAGPSARCGFETAPCLVWPPELSVLAASSSTLRALELFEVPLTDALIRGVVESCPLLTSLVVDSSAAGYIECSLSGPGLQLLSGLHSLQTLVLLPSLQRGRCLAAGGLTGGQEHTTEAYSAERELAELLARQVQVQPWRQQMLEREQQQLQQQRTLPWCINGSHLAAALSSLQCLHHLKVGVPFVPAQSVLELSALRCLQLLDLGHQDFGPWQESWEVAVGGYKETSLHAEEGATRATQLLAQLEAALPPHCRLLHWEGGF